MGFLNNSGDIVLDAVLTDTGRARLSKGDGSFKITKFALADDEIDYSLYNPNTGSAYVDLQILQSPILESFTNNASSMKNKLLTINGVRDILFLPVIKVNNEASDSKFANKLILNGFVVAVDKDTEDYLGSTDTTIGGANLSQGLLKGLTTSNTSLVRVDQGLDTNSETTLPLELQENQYIIEMDNRLATLLGGNRAAITPSYIDDDDIASYFLSLSTDPGSVELNSVSSTGAESQTGQVIVGPRGTTLKFAIESSLSAKTSTYLFTTLGTIYTGTRSPATGTLYVINSNITITGATTGYSIVIPIVFAKRVL